MVSSEADYMEDFVIEYLNNKIKSNMINLLSATYHGIDGEQHGWSHGRLCDRVFEESYQIFYFQLSIIE